jgi:glycosyltransferase involved in cell wall biosynthesis
MELPKIKIMEENSPKFFFGCDVTPCSSLTASEILNIYRSFITAHSELVLQECKNSKEGSFPSRKWFLLTEKRDINTSFSAWNFIEKNELQDYISYYPYYYSNPFENPGNMCDVWIGKNTPKWFLDDSTLFQALERSKQGNVLIGDDEKHVLFFTAFHPLKKEGNSTYMRMWLDALQNEGFIIHLVYYEYDLSQYSQDLLIQAKAMFPFFYSIPVLSKMVGVNENKLNIHLDDWCGIEVLEAIQKLCDQYDFEAVIVNYATFSKIFEIVPPTSKKVLLTIDRFANRNKRMLADGYLESGWMSISPSDETIACQRADLVVAIQDIEKEYFQKCINENGQVISIPQIFSRRYIEPRSDVQPLKIGYFGSSNYVNENNLVTFLKDLKKKDKLAKNCEILLAGGVSLTYEKFLDKEILEGLSIRKIGFIENLLEFFRGCNFIINPDRGGTGLKIKTLETLSYGMPILSTVAGFAGIPSESPFHQAASISDLVNYCEEIYNHPSLLKDLRQMSQQIYTQFFFQHQSALRNLLSSLVSDRTLISPRDQASTEIFVEGKAANHPIQSYPKVSVIIPFYNVEDYIDECIQSVLKQTYENLEIILIDDCSTDGTRRIVEEYALYNSNIKILAHTQNQGLGPARNTGVKNANGDYLFFLDSDDFLHKNAIQTLLTKAKEIQMEIVIGCADRIDSNRQFHEYDHQLTTEKDYGIIPGVNAFLRSFTVYNTPFLPVRAWGTLFERRMYLRAGFDFPPTEHEDMGTIPFIYYFSGKVAFIPDTIITYRTREKSISQSIWGRLKITRYRNLWTLIEHRTHRFHLENHLGNIAIPFVLHLFFRLQNNGFDEGCLQILGELVRDISVWIKPGDIEMRPFIDLMKSLHATIFDRFSDEAIYLLFTSGLDIDLLQAYYEQTLLNTCK